jgi:hypothetical protein
MNARIFPEEALLPWVPLSTQPQRYGVFQVRNKSRNELWFSFWDGEQWHGAWDSPAEAFRRGQFPTAGSVLAEWEWRGLAADPFAASPGAHVVAPAKPMPDWWPWPD